MSLITSRYDSVLKSGEAVLEGSQLDEAVKNLISTEEENISVDDLKLVFYLAISKTLTNMNTK